MMKWLIAYIALFAPLQLAHAADASLYMFPPTGEYAVDDLLTVMILADTGGSSIAAAEGEISYEPLSLELVSVSTDGSMLSTWSTDPSSASKPGLVRFAGWADEPFEGSSSLLLTLTFRGISNTPNRIQYVSGVLLPSNELGSNIVSVLRSGKYVVAPKRVTEEIPQNLEDIGRESSVETSGVPFDESSTVLPPPPPAITLHDTSIRAGNTITLQGTSVPNSKVHIWTTDSSGKTGAITVAADATGTFIFESPDEASSGVYRLYAVAEDERGVKSEPSNRIVVNVVPSSLALAFLALDTFGGMVLPMLMTLVFAGLLLGYLMFRKTRDRDEAYSHSGQ